MSAASMSSATRISTSPAIRAIPTSPRRSRSERRLYHAADETQDRLRCRRLEERHHWSQWWAAMEAFLRYAVFQDDHHGQAADHGAQDLGELAEAPASRPRQYRH